MAPEVLWGLPQRALARWVPHFNNLRSPCLRMIPVKFGKNPASVFEEKKQKCLMLPLVMREVHHRDNNLITINHQE